MKNVKTFDVYLVEMAKTDFSFKHNIKSYIDVIKFILLDSNFQKTIGKFKDLKNNSELFNNTDQAHYKSEYLWEIREKDIDKVLDNLVSDDDTVDVGIWFGEDELSYVFTTLWDENVFVIGYDKKNHASSYEKEFHGPNAKYIAEESVKWLIAEIEEIMDEKYN